MNVLILYATREGQTGKIAGRLAGRLETDGMHVTLANARDRDAVAKLDPASFDLVVLGASMHAGRLERELTRFIGKHAAAIARVPRSLFVVLLAAATKNPERRKHALADASRRVAAQLAVGFADVEWIAGALAYTRYGWLTRWTMRRIARAEGGDTDTSRDHEYTDWQQVEAYADRLAQRAGLRLGS